MNGLYSFFCYLGLKTWAERVRGDLLEVREGTQSLVRTYRAIPRDECLRRDPVAEMDLRVVLGSRP